MERRTAFLLFFVMVGVIAIGLAGCATGPTTTAPAKTLPEMLKAAGFKVYSADTPQKMAHLQSCPTDKLMIHEWPGNKCYAFADQTAKTMYIGDEAAYGRLRKALEVQEQKIEEQRIQNDPQFLQLWMGSQGGG